MAEQTQRNEQPNRRRELNQKRKEHRKARRSRIRKKKWEKTLVYRAWDKKGNMPVAVVVLMVILASIIELIRLILRLLLWLIIIVIILCLLAGAFVAGKLYPVYQEYQEEAIRLVSESTVETFRPQESSYIYDANGNVMAKLRGDQDSAYLEYEDIPEEVVNAFVAVEDRTFWDNPGFDVSAIIRVGLDFIRTKGEEMHGASTITQQLARNVFLTHEVSLERKAKEILISRELTQKYTKEQIMEFYVNNVCFANAYYGIEAAAQGYFSKSADELNLSELVYLCAIPNSPTFYDPYKHPDRAIERRDKILNDMLEIGYINLKEYDEALNTEININKPEYEMFNYETTYAIDCAVRYLMEQEGFEFIYDFEDMSSYNTYIENYNTAYENAKNELYTGGYKVYTTIDPQKQADMQAILNEGLSFEENINEETGEYLLQGAMTVIDNETGKVVAIIGGRTSEENEVDTYSLNRAYQSYRQPGSTIKPLAVYAPALMKGFTPESQLVNISVPAAKEKGVDVSKLGGNRVAFKDALRRSLNGCAWWLFNEIGPEFGLSFLHDMEFTKILPSDYGLASSLGGLTYGTTTVEMASGFGILENHGFYRQPTCIRGIFNGQDEDIYVEEEARQVYSAKASDDMTEMLQNVLKNGTASKLGWSKYTKTEAAGKTGTTNESKDGWFCGYTPYYTIAVWVGYDQPKELSSLWGSTYPAQIWRDGMLKLIEDKEVAEFEVDESLYENDLVLPDEELKDSSADAANKYLAGRPDDEVLSSGYTVGDYRADRVIGESIDAVIGQIQGIDKTSPTWQNDLNNLYTQGQALVESIYSQKYTSEMNNKLQSAYNAKLAQP